MKLIGLRGLLTAQRNFGKLNEEEVVPFLSSFSTVSVVVFSTFVSVDSVLRRFSSEIPHTTLEVSTESVKKIKNVSVN